MAKDKLYRWWWSIAKLRKEYKKWHEKIIGDNTAASKMHVLSAEIERKKNNFRWMVPIIIKILMGGVLIFFTIKIYLQGK